MAIIKEDTIEDQRINISASGLQRIRSFKFSGLLHGPNNDPLGEAYRMLQDRGIDYRQPHPVLTNISVVNIDGGHVNRTPTQAKLLVTYGYPETGELSGQMTVTISSSTSRQIVRHDKNGRIMWVDYVPSGQSPTGDAGVAGVRMVGEVPKLVSHLILEFEFERGTPPARDLTGAKNSVLWQDGQPGQWVCRECFARRIMGRTLWRTKLGFEFDKEYWDKAAVFRDPYTGVIPKDVDDITFVSGTNEGNGWKRYESFDQYNFNSLALPVIYPEDSSFNGSPIGGPFGF